MSFNKGSSFASLVIVVLAANAAAFTFSSKEELASFSAPADVAVNPLISRLTGYELVSPTVKSEHDMALFADGTFPSKLTYSINAYGKEFQLNLEQNDALVVDTYVEIRMDYSDSSKPEGIEERRESPVVNCFYQGSVDGDDESSVTISACGGLRGVVKAHGESFNIAPALFSQRDPRAPQTAFQSMSTAASLPTLHASVHKPFPLSQVSGTQHFVYRDSDVPGEQAYEPSHCGVQDTLSLIDKAIAKQDAQPKAQALAAQYTIELLAFNDEARFRALGDGTEHDTLELYNLASSYYRNTPFVRPLHMVLVGQVTFTNGDPYQKRQGASGIDVEGQSGLLITFNNWRTSPGSNLPAHDNGQLLSGLGFTSGIRGLAGVGAMCTQQSGSICQVDMNSLATKAMIAAHETGHTLAMLHDGGGNTCQAGFIMEPSTGGNTRFSDCSIRYTNEWLQTRDTRCLENSVEVDLPATVKTATAETVADAAAQPQPSVQQQLPAYLVGCVSGAALLAIVAAVVLKFGANKESKIASDKQAPATTEVTKLASPGEADSSMVAPQTV